MIIAAVTGRVLAVTEWCALFKAYIVSHTCAVKMSYFTDTRHVLPDGVFPTMITPMNEDKSVDWAGVDCKSTQSQYCL